MSFTSTIQWKYELTSKTIPYRVQVPPFRMMYVFYHFFQRLQTEAIALSLEAIAIRSFVQVVITPVGSGDVGSRGSSAEPPQLSGWSSSFETRRVPRGLAFWGAATGIWVPAPNWVDCLRHLEP